MLIHIQCIRLLREVVRPHDLPCLRFCITFFIDNDLLGLLFSNTLVEFRYVDACPGLAQSLKLE